MKNHKSKIELLNDSIVLLEVRRRNEYEDLKLQFYETSENFRPINILNQFVKDFREIPDTKTNLFEIIFSIAGGYFSKKIIVGNSNSIIKNIFGYLLQYTISNFIAKKVRTESEE